MKRSKRILAAFILGLFVFASASSTQAASSVKDGVYFTKTSEYYSMEQLSGLTFQRISALFTNNKTTEVYIYIVNVGTASLAEANESSFINAANKNGNKNNPENVIPNGNYKEANGNVIEVEGTSKVDVFEVTSIE